MAYFSRWERKSFLMILTVLCAASALFGSEQKETPSSVKKALIIGITGQDGSYLSELLLDKGYEVHGIKRRSSNLNTQRVDHLYVDLHQAKRPKFVLHYGDVVDSINLLNIINEVRPDEVYNLAAQSHVKVSFELPEYTGNVDALGTLRVLEAIKLAGLEKKTKFYQASTSEMYGLVQEVPQTEKTPFYPRSPYGVAKLYAHWITKNYREAYGMFACSGILFNHESPRRGETFVTRKIVQAIAGIKAGKVGTLFLGNLDAKRDWGHARDYVYAMWLMLQQEQPDDYVIATGETHSVREFVEEAFKEVGIDLEWRGSGVNEKGIDKETGKVVVAVDPKYFRPTEVDFLLGDSTKAKERLGWTPNIKFHELVKEMMQHELEQINKTTSK